LYFFNLLPMLTAEETTLPTSHRRSTAAGSPRGSKERVETVAIADRLHASSLRASRQPRTASSLLSTFRAVVTSKAQLALQPARPDRKHLGDGPGQIVIGPAAARKGHFKGPP
jgi:hypothetical protein